MPKEEPPMVIETREELIFLLSEAAALEHMVLCGYLFAAFTLKERPEEGVTNAQLEAVSRWNRVIRGVAAQEMLHLSLVNNLLTSIGAAPYFGRPNFPHPARYFAPGVHLALLPFGEKALRHFLFLERPETFYLEDAEGFEVSQAAVPHTVGDELVPEAQSYSTIGHLYRGIENGFDHLAEKFGEKRLFVGSRQSQATQESFGWPELVKVTDLKSAREAIKTIITEGEGARGHWKKSHFGKFHQVLDEYLALKKADPRFEPARPAVPACARQPADVRTIARVTDLFTAGVADLFNASYEVTLQLLSRFFMHTESTPAELQILSDSAVKMMVLVVDPLGRLLTSLPLGEHHPGLTAGPSFEMYHKEYLLPHRHTAWVLLHERLTELAAHCRSLADRAPGESDLSHVQSDLEQLAAALEPHARASTREPAA